MRLFRTRKYKAGFETCPECVWDYDGYDKYYVGRVGDDVTVYDCMRCRRRCEYRSDPSNTGPTAPVWFSE